jgi:hypothetical protein
MKIIMLFVAVCATLYVLKYNLLVKRKSNEFRRRKEKRFVRSLDPPAGDGRTLAASLLQVSSPPSSPAAAAGVVRRAFPAVLAAAGRLFPVRAEGGAGPPDGDGALRRRRPGSAD